MIIYEDIINRIIEDTISKIKQEDKNTSILKEYGFTNEEIQVMKDSIKYGDMSDTIDTWYKVSTISTSSIGSFAAKSYAPIYSSIMRKIKSMGSVDIDKDGSKFYECDILRYWKKPPHNRDYAGFTNQIYFNMLIFGDVDELKEWAKN